MNSIEPGGSSWSGLLFALNLGSSQMATVGFLGFLWLHASECTLTSFDTLYIMLNATQHVQAVEYVWSRV